MLKDRPIESPERGIPTQLAGPQNLPTIDDFEGDSDPASWAPKPPPQSTISKGIPTQLAGPQNLHKIKDFEGDSDPASWAPQPPKLIFSPLGFSFLSPFAAFLGWGPLPLGFFIGGPFNAAQHIARQPAPQCLAPWPPGRGRQTCFGPLNILKGTRDHICLNPSAMLCFHTLSCTNFSDSRQTPVPRGHYCVKSAMFFTRNCQTVSDTRAASALLRQKCYVFKKP